MALTAMAITLMAATPNTALAADKTERPNFVFVLADDMSWYGTGTRMQAGLAVSSDRTRRTPVLDRLAKSGMTFSRAFAPAGMCAPSRCSIQTGMTTARTGFSGNGNFGSTSREVTYDSRRNKGRLMLEPSPLGNLYTGHDTIGEYLKRLGYATAHLGKWHVYGGGPGKHGYDVHDGETSNAEGNSNDPRDPKHIFSMTRKANAFMETQVKANKPFFVQVSHYAEHNAVQSLPETLEACLKDPMIKRIQPSALAKRVAARTAMVKDMDTSIGQLLQKIDELGIADNTYVVFTSDNGHHRDSGEPKPLRGTKWWLWEGGIRVPMIVTGPGIKSGSRSDVNVVLYDLLPTFFALAGGDTSKLKDVDGASIAGLLHGQAPGALASRPLYFHYPHHRNTAMHSAIIQGDFKLFRFYEQPDKKYLYDLKRDLGESRNVVADGPNIAARLDEQLDQYFSSINAALPKPNPDAPRDYNPYDPDAPDAKDKLGHSDKQKAASTATGNKPGGKPDTKANRKARKKLERQKRREQKKAAD